MKKVQLKELFMMIKGSFIRFSSLFLIISLGLSSYLEISFAARTIVNTEKYYYKEAKFEHVKLSYRYGFSEETLNEIEKIEHVTKVEGGYTTTGFLDLDEKKRLVTIEAITDSINLATVIQGRLPNGKDEIAIEEILLHETDI